MLKILNTIILFILLTTKSYSEVINKVNVINNDRITQETILVFSNIEIGKNYSLNDLNEIIKDLYETNFFSNVSLNLIDGVLTIDVKENKVIQEIKIKNQRKYYHLILLSNALK